MNKPRGRPFQPGNQLGRGRPKGSRNKATHAAQRLLEQHSEALARKCIIEALHGNMPALKLCMERVAPVRREAPVHIKLPGLSSARDIAASGQAVGEAVASGRLTPSEGEKLTNILESQRKAIETAELQLRMEQLERAAPNFQATGGEPD